MAQISLILIGNCSILDCEHDCEDDFEHEIVVRTFLDALELTERPTPEMHLTALVRATASHPSVTRIRIEPPKWWSEWWSRVPRLTKLYLLATVLVVCGASGVYADVRQAVTSIGTDRFLADLAEIDLLHPAMVVLGALLFSRVEWARAWTNGLMVLSIICCGVLCVQALILLRPAEFLMFVLLCNACMAASNFLEHSETKELFRRKTREVGAEASPASSPDSLESSSCCPECGQDLNRAKEEMDGADEAVEEQAEWLRTANRFAVLGVIAIGVALLDILKVLARNQPRAMCYPDLFVIAIMVACMAHSYWRALR